MAKKLPEPLIDKRQRVSRRLEECGAYDLRERINIGQFDGEIEYFQLSFASATVDFIEHDPARKLGLRQQRAVRDGGEARKAAAAVNHAQIRRDAAEVSRKHPDWPPEEVAAYLAADAEGDPERRRGRSLRTVKRVL